jgi:hypothetical protein
MRPGQGPISCDDPLDAALVRVLIMCMFVRVIICHIYETILQTVKVATCNLLRGIKIHSIIY